MTMQSERFKVSEVCRNIYSECSQRQYRNSSKKKDRLCPLKPDKLYPGVSYEKQDKDQ